MRTNDFGVALGVPTSHPASPRFQFLIIPGPLLSACPDRRFRPGAKFVLPDACSLAPLPSRPPGSSGAPCTSVHPAHLHAVWVTFFFAGTCLCWRSAGRALIGLFSISQQPSDSSAHSVFTSWMPLAGPALKSLTAGLACWGLDAVSLTSASRPLWKLQTASRIYLSGNRCRNTYIYIYVCIYIYIYIYM